MAHQANVGNGEDVVNHGFGGVGLSAIQTADTLGANVIDVDLLDEKLGKAEEPGIVDTVNAETVDDPAEEAFVFS